MQGKSLSHLIENMVIQNFWQAYCIPEKPEPFPIEFKPLACSVGGIMLRNNKPGIIIDDSFENSLNNPMKITLDYTASHETAHCLLIQHCISGALPFPERRAAETLASLTALSFLKSYNPLQSYENEVNEEGQEGLSICQ